MHPLKLAIVFWALISIQSTSVLAQTINLSDSLRHVLRSKPMPTAKLDSRNSFVTGNSAQIQGVKAGLSYKKVLSFGLGYNWLATDFTERKSYENVSYEAFLKLRYVAPFIEYSFYKKGPWEVAVPLQIGAGKSFWQIEKDGQKIKLNEGNVWLYEPIMTVEYKVLNLIGIGGGVGYRIMLKNNREIERQFTSPVYVIRARIIFDEVIKKIKQHKSD
jgi:hypothetical protein